MLLAGSPQSLPLPYCAHTPVLPGNLPPGSTPLPPLSVAPTPKLPHFRDVSSDAHDKH